MSSSGASWAKLSETVSTTVERCVVSESSPDACLSEKALRGDPGVCKSIPQYRSSAVCAQCSGATEPVRCRVGPLTKFSSSYASWPVAVAV